MTWIWGDSFFGGNSWGQTEKFNFFFIYYMLPKALTHARFLVTNFSSDLDRVDSDKNEIVRRSALTRRWRWWIAHDQGWNNQHTTGNYSVTDLELIVCVEQGGLSAKDAYKKTLQCKGIRAYSLLIYWVNKRLKRVSAVKKTRPMTTSVKRHLSNAPMLQSYVNFVSNTIGKVRAKRSANIDDYVSCIL